MCRLTFPPPALTVKLPFRLFVSRIESGAVLYALVLVGTVGTSQVWKNFRRSVLYVLSFRYDSLWDLCQCACQDRIGLAHMTITGPFGELTGETSFGSSH